MAGRLYARALNGADGDAALLAAAELLCARLVDGLARWFGGDGARTLVTRALARVQPTHPPLVSLTLGARAESPTAPCLIGLAESARVHGATNVSVGFVALLGALTEALCRLLGTELAVSILEQTAGASVETATTVTVPSHGSVAPATRATGRGGVEESRADVARPPADPELPTMVAEP
ncbi:MAG: hypothetical protein H0W68_03440 [Gemmatimonadaceae bacterium]|nr:hypothetical protein [Gemmatimonadaceae bacterium]